MQPQTSKHPQTSKNGNTTKADVKDQKKVFQDEAPSGAVAKPEGEAAEAPAPVLTPAQKRSLFDEVFRTEKGIKDAEAAVKAASDKRSEAVKALIAGMNGKTGPWKVDGQLLRARIRGDSAYLLRPDDLDVEVI